MENFPVTVVNDIYGGDLYEEGKAKYKVKADWVRHKPCNTRVNLPATGRSWLCLTCREQIDEMFNQTMMHRNMIECEAIRWNLSHTKGTSNLSFDILK